MTRTIFGVLALALLCLAGTVSAAEKNDLTVRPLADDFDGSGAQPGLLLPGTDPAGKAVAPRSGSDAGDASGDQAPAIAGGREDVSGAAASRDGMVISYLIDLARKQNRPCPSGVTPPLPPPLVFSEPLCRVAEAVDNGAEFSEALSRQGLFAQKWRMFTAAEPSAQKVAAGLLRVHCEALSEPHTHIGAVRGAGGWRIIMAVLADKPPSPVPGTAGEAPDAAAPESAPGTTPSSAPDTAPGSAPQPPTDELSMAASAAVPVAAASAVSTTPPLLADPPAAAAPGQEARKLFVLVNSLRAKGGACFGKQKSPAPALVFDAALQVAAEDAVAKAAARGGFSGESGGTPGKVTGMERYSGTGVTKLTLAAGPHASVALDTWMLVPSQCEALFAPRFADAGAAYANGHWVLLLGSKGVGVPSPEVPGGGQ